MKAKLGLVLGLVVLGAVPLVACSSDFTSCTESRTCPAGGAAGQDGKGGSPQNLGEAGEGGAADQPGPGEHGGEGGETAAPDTTPALFRACSVKGAIACDGHATAERLACDGSKWQAGTTCAAGKLCDSSDGKCVAQVEECVDVEPGAVVCRGDVLLTCGADLVTATEGKTCAGLCQDGVCQAARCGDEKLEKGEDCDDPEATASGACVKCKTAACGDGAVYADHEQCDDGNTVGGDGCSATCKAEPVALALGTAVSCMLSSTGIVKCWGDNRKGAAGLGKVTETSDVPSKLPAVDLGTGRIAKAISVWGQSVCAVLDKGDVKCWGDNSSGQLGTNDTDNRGDEAGEMGDALKPLPLGRPATAVSIGYDHACAVLDNGTLKCWGSGTHGQLGTDSASDQLVPPTEPINLGRSVAAVSAGWWTTCASLDNGSAKCWGYRAYLSASDSADLAPTSGGIGDYTGEMSLLQATNFGAGRTAKSISAGPVSCALLDNASLKCWGDAYEGNAGQPQVGTFGRTPEELAALPPIDLGNGKRVKSMALSIAHACAVLEGGELKCWGFNSFGQLGLGSTESKGVNPGDMGDALKPVYLEGKRALQVAAGENHTCALLSDGTVKCWGRNLSHELGLKDTRLRGDIGGQLSTDTTVDLSF